jgi:hypothetical protein
MTPAPTSPAGTGTTGFLDSTARTYAFTGLASILVIAAVMLVRPNGSLLAAVFPGLVAVLAILTRWSAFPAFFLLLLAYFLASPLGIPSISIRDMPVRFTHFRLLDLVLVGAVLTYLAAQYRLTSLTDRAVPPDASGGSSANEKPMVRPGANHTPGEFGRLFAILAACVVGGQLVWLVVTEFEVDYYRFPHIRLSPDTARPARTSGLFDATTASSRFLLFSGIAILAVLSTGLVLWYRGLTRLSPVRARMVLLDVLWRENRRELDRQEKWRAWAIARSRPALERFHPPRAPGELRRIIVRMVLLFAVIVLFWATIACVLANMI